MRELQPSFDVILGMFDTDANTNVNDGNLLKRCNVNMSNDYIYFVLSWFFII